MLAPKPRRGEFISQFENVKTQYHAGGSMAALYKYPQFLAKSEHNAFDPNSRT